MADRAPSPPKGLGPAGAALWRQVQRALDPGWEFDERERAVLTLACRQRDDIAALERELARSKVIVTGSKGQPVLSQIVGELRQQRLAVAKLLAALTLPQEDAATSPASARATKAARARWSKVDSLAERRRHAREKRSRGSS